MPFCGAYEIVRHRGYRGLQNGKFGKRRWMRQQESATRIGKSGDCPADDTLSPRPQFIAAPFLHGRCKGEREIETQGEWQKIQSAVPI